MNAATRGIVIAFGALALASLLNAQGLRKTAQTQPQGVRRQVALAVTRPLARASRFLYLDRPRHELQLAVGRGDVDRIDTRVLLVAPAVQPPRPAPRDPRMALPSRTRKPPRQGLFTRRRPLRIWVAGDSLALIPGQALERAVGQGGPVQVLGIESRLDTGLTRPDLYNWFVRIRQALPQLRPNVAVLSLGADDEHDYMSGVPVGHRIGPLGSPSWVAEYRRRVDGITRELIAAHVYVVWIGLPITRGDGYRRGFQVVNAVIRAVAAGHRSSSTFVDTWDMFLNGRGEYADYLRSAHGRLVLMRAPDGVHYEPAAGDMIARIVLKRLHGVYSLRG